MNDRINRSFTLLMLLSLLIQPLAAVPSFAADKSAPTEVELEIWRKIPVFHHGRVMPVDTLAKVAVETICHGGSKVKLGLKDYYTPDELAGSDLEGALEMFPYGETRKIPAIEVLLSWLLETEKWEDVPFIYCAHADLHEALGLETKTVTGIHRKYISPRAVAESEHLVSYLNDLQDRQEAASSAREDFHQTKTDERVGELLNRYRVYRKLTLNPRLNLTMEPVPLPGNREEFARHVQTAVAVANEKMKIDGARGEERSLRDLLSDLIQQHDPTGQGNPVTRVVQLELDALDELNRLSALLHAKGYGYHGPVSANMPNPKDLPDVSLEDAEQIVVLFRQATGQVYEMLASLKKMVRDDDGFMGGGDQAFGRVRAIAAKSEDLKRQAREIHLALYDNGAQFNDGDEFRYGATVYVTPALNPAALRKEPKTDDPQARQKMRANRPEPWLSLQAVLHGSDELLYGQSWEKETYSKSDVKAVRAAWDAMAKAYTNRDNPGRAEAVNRAQTQLSVTLRQLGTGVESKRLALVDSELPDDQQDEDLIQYTTYSGPGRLDAEISYNRVKPFVWSWVICLGSVLAFSLSFGVMRAKMFWAAMALLAVGIIWTAYGFALRILVTGWAPVTNMYETVVFVPWVIAVMAMWFVLLPLTWSSIKDAWRLTAIPGTWEASPLSREQQAMFSPTTWTAAGGASVVARVALMAFVFRQLAMVPYSDGNRTIFYLWPSAEALDLNNAVVYIVNMLCLVAIVWFSPRVMLALAGSLVLMPINWFRGQRGRVLSDVMPQVYSRWVFGICGAAGAAFFFMIAAYAPVLDEDFRPLQPVLRSNFWLTIHVLTIVASYGAGLLAWLVGLIGLSYYLFGRYRTPVVAENVPKGMQPADGAHVPERLAKLPPEVCHTLANYCYRAIQVAVLLLAAGTILGGLWADVSWGRFWGWDPKEVWALISLLVYLAILHGRFAGWFNNFGMIAGTIIGAVMIGGSWYGVNFVLPMFAGEGESVGLHSYGSGAGGQGYVFAFVLLNLLYLGLASLRYYYETSSKVKPVEHTPEVFQADVTGEARPQGT